MVNTSCWDPQARTALSDIEVIHKDDKGAFTMKYKFADGKTKLNGKDYIEIATTRQTMMGDTAIAVNAGETLQGRRWQESYFATG